MAQRLSGKSAVVTGSGGGIGRAVALALAAEGAKVVINDIGKDADGKMMADKVVEEIKGSGGTAVANYDSVASIAGGQAIVKAAVSNFGKIDILANVAGNYLLGKINDMTEANWDSVIAVHLKGHFACSQAAVKEMIMQKSGRIVNITSSGGFNYTPPGSLSIAYATAKAGIVGFTIANSAFLKQYNITVNCIFPGAITKLFPALTKGGFGSKKREGPEFVAPTIAFLCTDAAQNITGQFISAQGGELCIYSRPFQQPGPHMFCRKLGQWTIDELSEVIPSLIGQG